MWILFGTSNRKKELGQASYNCPKCGHETVHSVRQQQNWFTLFFLPIFPLSGANQISRCNLCGLETPYSPATVASPYTGGITTDQGAIPLQQFGTGTAIPQKTNTLARISFITGIIALITSFCGVFGALFGIPSLITGIIGIKQINTSNEKGKGMAIAGVIISSIALIIAVVSFILLVLGPVIGNAFSNINSNLVAP